MYSYIFFLGGRGCPAIPFEMVIAKAFLRQPSPAQHSCRRILCAAPLSLGFHCGPTLAHLEQNRNHHHSKAKASTKRVYSPHSRGSAVSDVCICLRRIPPIFILWRAERTHSEPVLIFLRMSRS